MRHKGSEGQAVCSSEQRSLQMTRTVPLMRFQQLHGSLGAIWILGAGLIGLLGNVTSIGGAAMILGLGLVPPMLLMARWNHPVPVPVHRANP